MLGGVTRLKYTLDTIERIFHKAFKKFLFREYMCLYVLYHKAIEKFLIRELYDNIYNSSLNRCLEIDKQRTRCYDKAHALLLLKRGAY